jgi:hypothetical protein
MNDMTLPANTEEPEQAKAPAIEAYKGFKLDLTCRTFQYEIGKSYSMKGKIEACSRGFHACEHPLDVLNYYPPNTSRFALVELGGQMAREENSDTKIAAAEITIKAELRLPDLIKRAVHWVAERAKAQGNGQYAAGSGGHASSAGSGGHASSAGSGGHASSAGYRGHASSAGYRGHASSAGDYGHASSAGDYGHASSAGDYGHASSAGSGGHASSAGYRGHASSAGYRGHASSAGYRGHASSAGYRGHASSAGYRGHASSAGDYGHASSAGYRGHASVKGQNAIAASLGASGTAKAEANGAIMLAAYDDDGKLVAVFSSLVGSNGVEAGKVYRLSVDGSIEQVEEPSND